MSAKNEWVKVGSSNPDGRFELQVWVRWTEQNETPASRVEIRIDAVRTNSLFYNNLDTAWSVSGLISASGAWRTGNPWSTMTIYSWAGWVNHAANGTLTVTVGASTAAKSPAVARSASGSLAMPTITRAPNAPSNVVLTRRSDTQMVVSWTRNEPANGTATSYDLQSSVNAGGFAGTVSIAPASSLVMSCAGNQKVQVWVRAFNSRGASSWTTSNVMWTTPGAPSMVREQIDRWKSKLRLE